MRNKKYYCSPVSDIIALQVEGPLWIILSLQVRWRVFTLMMLRKQQFRWTGFFKEELS